jgi:hypothetical protein
MRYPFTLYKVKSKCGIMWHARFWDDMLKKYAHSRTKHYRRFAPLQAPPYGGTWRGHYPPRMTADNDNARF